MKKETDKRPSKEVSDRKDDEDTRTSKPSIKSINSEDLLQQKYTYLNLIGTIILHTGQSLDYIFGDYHKICKNTYNNCHQESCIFFHNIKKYKEILDCPNIKVKLKGLTLKQLIVLSLYLRYHEYSNILTYKRHIVDVVNAIFAKNYEIKQNNVYIKPLLKSLDVNVDKELLEDDKQIFKDIILEQNIIKKYNKFMKLKSIVYTKYYEEDNILYRLLLFDEMAIENFQKDPLKTNSILTNDKDKKFMINTLTNIYKIILLFPNHTNLNITKDMIDAIKVKVNNNLLNKNKKIDYLSGDYDDDRFKTLTGNDELLKYVASIDSYFYIYKKTNNNDFYFQLLLELYDYIDNVINSLKNNKENSHMLPFFEAKKDTIKKIIEKHFNVNVDNLI